MKPYKKTWKLPLSFGDKGDAVKWLQERLLSQGFFKGVVRGNFKSMTQDALRNFQASHIDSRGLQLIPDGIMGKLTQWALRNPSGDKQVASPRTYVSNGASSKKREKLVSIAINDLIGGEYYEDPDGSNWGERLSTFLTGKYPWCAFYISNLWKRAFGKYPLGKNHGHVLTFWREAKKRGMAFKSGTTKPLVGDLGVYLYKNKSGNLTGSGHIFLVVASDGDYVNTIGGNEGNALRFKWRKASSAYGWISLFNDDRERIWKKMKKDVKFINSSKVTLANTR